MVSVVDPGCGAPTRISKRHITHPDGTRTIITTTTVGAGKDATETVETARLPSEPRVRREAVTRADGTAGWRKRTTVVHPDGRRETTVEHPDGTSETSVEQGPAAAPVPAAPGPAAPEEEPETPWDSILTRLRRHATATPDKGALSFLRTQGNGTPTVASSLTYARLHFAVEYLAARLRPPPTSTTAPVASLEQGDRVLLVYPPCAPHFVLGFLACLRAGLVAVPVYPPHPGRRNSIAAFVGIARGCGAKAALTNGEYAQAKRLGELKTTLSSRPWKKKPQGEGGADAATWPEELVWVVTDKEPLEEPPAPPTNITAEAIPAPQEIAFIQYTSGSTSAPKGVMLTHANLSHNLTIITNELEASPETTVVSWLPQYHDMGLIGSLLGVLYCGGSGYYLSPLAFLQRPMGWLEAVSHFRGTHLQAPNFAFGLTARKFDPGDYRGPGPPRAAPLDLSCVKHVINGAEPVTEKSMGAFVAAFGPFGLPEGAIYPTYGLAEHTVFVCSGGRGKLAVRKQELEEDRKVVVVAEAEGSAEGEEVAHFFGCGFPKRQGVDVRIAEPVGRAALPEDRVGEIWIHSPSKARGYYGRGAAENAADFHAAFDGAEAAPENADGYLRSGDLGFLHGEQLYVCGRLKDLIIVNGRNLYPQDLEATAEEVAADHARPGCAAAFSVGAAEEGEGAAVVLALELKDPVPSAAVQKSLAEAVRAEVVREHSLPLSCVVWVKQKTMPKTTSGKIQRAKAQQAYLKGTLAEVSRRDFTAGEAAAGGGGVAAAAAAVPDGDGPPAPAPGTARQTPAELRALKRPAIRALLLESLAGIAGVAPAAIDPKAPLTSYLDSVMAGQLKGLLEGRYAVRPLSNEYLLYDSTTAKKLVEVIKVGVAKDDVGERGSVAAPAGGGGAPLCCGCTVM